MQAIKLSKKYPEFKQEEIFDLINKFQCVFIYPKCSLSRPIISLDGYLWSCRSRCRQIDVDDKKSLDKAQVISALQASGDADYDSVS